jgi:hypothetical protein
MEVDYVGGCPTCGRNDGYLKARRTHEFYCLEHRVSWIYGANTFSGWRDETEAQQIEKYRLIEDFERVEPIWREDAHVVFSPPLTGVDELPLVTAATGDVRIVDEHDGTFSVWVAERKRPRLQ